MHESAVEEVLRAGLRELDLPWVDSQLSALLEYIAMLDRWNASFNLTSVRDPLQMVSRHLLDSLAIAEHIPASARRVVDVGSGGGLPGIPLAIMQPHRDFELLDSNGKKTRFLFQVKTALGLDNMEVHQVRAEDWHPTEPYDVVLSRAFASLPDMVACCRHMCSSNGRFLAMKGQLPQAEIDELMIRGGDTNIASIHSLRVPGLAEDRHLIELRLFDVALAASEIGKNCG